MNPWNGGGVVARAARGRPEPLRQFLDLRVLALDTGGGRAVGLRTRAGPCRRLRGDQHDARPVDADLLLALHVQRQRDECVAIRRRVQPALRQGRLRRGVHGVADRRLPVDHLGQRKAYTVRTGLLPFEVNAAHRACKAAALHGPGRDRRLGRFDRVRDARMHRRAHDHARRVVPCRSALPTTGRHQDEETRHATAQCPRSDVRVHVLLSSCERSADSLRMRRSPTRPSALRRTQNARVRPPGSGREPRGSARVRRGTPLSSPRSSR